MTRRRFPPHEHYPAGDASVAPRQLVVGRESVRILESGDPGSFPIVLLHGWGGSAYNFRDVLPALGRSGFHAIAPDLRGHGWSDATNHAPGAWSAPAMAEWTRRLLDELRIGRCVLVGQSIGGAIAMDAASIMPDRVAALVLFASIGFTHVRRVRLARGPAWLYPSFSPRWVVAWVLRRIYGSRAQWSEHDVDEYWIPLRRRGVVRALMQSAREFDFTPRDPKVLQLASPLVVRFGELDGLIPHSLAVRHAHLFRGADVAVLPGVGHVPAEEVPDEASALIVRVANEVGGQRSEVRATTSEL
jgi:pimeloyl-ACP methyl ester carboxylesterase